MDSSRPGPKAVARVMAVVLKARAEAVVRAVVVPGRASICLPGSGAWHRTTGTRNYASRTTWMGVNRAESIGATRVCTFVASLSVLSGTTFGSAPRSGSVASALPPPRDGTGGYSGTIGAAQQSHVGDPKPKTLCAPARENTNRINENSEVPVHEMSHSNGRHIKPPHDWKASPTQLKNENAKSKGLDGWQKDLETDNPRQIPVDRRGYNAPNPQ